VGESIVGQGLHPFERPSGRLGAGEDLLGRNHKDVHIISFIPYLIYNFV